MTASDDEIRAAMQALIELVECKAEVARAMGGLGVDVVRLGIANLRLDAAWDRARALIARNSADTDRPRSDEQKDAAAHPLPDAAQRVIAAAKAVSYSNGFDAALPAKQAELHAALKALEKP